MVNKLIQGEKETPEGNYFRHLAEFTYDPSKLNSIKKSIDIEGFWEESIEWRISTVMDSRIEIIEENSKKWYRVTIKCDHEFRCHTQTIERAAYFAALYRKLIIPKTGGMIIFY
jgi:hypothetical protein